MLRKTYWFAVFVLLLITAACDTIDPVDPVKNTEPQEHVDPANMDTFTDLRDGKVYKTIKIGTQVWMAENFCYQTSESFFYNEDSVKFATKYGRLYSWQSAIDAAPDGWRLPTEADLETLLTYTGGGEENGYNKLRTGGSTGFNAQPGGIGTTEKQFRDIETNANFWTSTGAEDLKKTLSVINRPAYNHKYAGIGEESAKTKYLSVRYIKQ